MEELRRVEMMCEDMNRGADEPKKELRQESVRDIIAVPISKTCPSLLYKHSHIASKETSATRLVRFLHVLCLAARFSQASRQRWTATNLKVC